jgi:hypothetical protein
MAALPSSNPPARDEIVPLRQLVELLAPAVGKDRSTELVVAAARDRGVAAERLTLAIALDILAALSTTEGIVGVAARLAKTRLVSQRKGRPSLPSIRIETIPAPTRHSAPPPAEAAATTIEVGEIVRLLAHTVGSEKSDQLVRAALQSLGITNSILEPKQALALLDTLAQAPGIAGIASRFAKARLILRLER